MNQEQLTTSVTTLANNNYGIESHTWNALKTVVYDGAKDESIKLVLDYCKANELDPLQKPVHIVQTGAYNSQNKWVSKDTIWPSIGLYRIQAERSGKYAGLSEPEYGDTIEGVFYKVDRNGSKQQIKVSYPEWCKITVKKIVQGQIAEYTVKEYWLENYARANSKSTAPNTMWQTRAFGQLAKVSEAQALRKAFPEIISQRPTADEIEGKLIQEVQENNKSIDNVYKKLDKLLEDKEIINENKPNLSDHDFNHKEHLVINLKDLIEKHNVSSDVINKWLEAGDASSLDELTNTQLDACINRIIDSHKTHHHHF